MPQRDIRNSAIIGFLVALLLYVIRITGNIPHLHTIPFFEASLIVFPLLSVLGIYIASVVAKKFAVVLQGTKFLFVGALNTFVDLGILNVLIAAIGISTGIGFSVFKAISFLAALLNSYLWNKSWTFRAKKDHEQDFAKKRKEFLGFAAISGIGFLLNVGTASIVVNVVGPQFDISSPTWATVAALIGTFVVLTWNFLGYKLMVFKR